MTSRRIYTEANEGALEGGETGTVADTNENNSIAEDEQQDNGRFDIPTNGAPSPLFGAEPFSQQMLRFEEFGTGSSKTRSKDQNLQAIGSPYQPLLIRKVRRIA